MNSRAGQEAQGTPVFAGSGRAWDRLVRAAAVGAVALFAGWLIALALGVFGRFESLPPLPESKAAGRNASEPNSKTQPTNRTAVVEPWGNLILQPRQDLERLANHAPGNLRAPSPLPKPVLKAPSAMRQTIGGIAATWDEHGIGIGRTNRERVGSPGNGLGESDTPAQFR
jgi:hypothetical protein